MSDNKNSNDKSKVSNITISKSPTSVDNNSLLTNNKSINTIDSKAESIVNTTEDLRPATYASRIGILLRKLPMLTQKAKAAAYTSEVGESFRPVIHARLVKFLYGISIGYVIVDVAGRSYCVSDQGRSKTSYFIFDTLLWHSLASLILPAVVIHSLVKYSGKGIKKITSNKKAVAWIPAIIALGSVPFIIHPIDVVTDLALDNLVRPLYVDKIAKEAEVLRH